MPSLKAQDEAITEKEDRPLPFIDLVAQQARIRQPLEAAILRVLDHGHYIMGPECQEAERKLSELAQTPYVAGCSDGTDALTMVMMALDLRPGDAVFVPSFTFISTAEIVALRGATPVFVDIDPSTFTLSVPSLESAISRARALGLSPRGVISVDLFGLPADHDAILAVSRREQIWVVNDAAQSLGATYKGRPTASYGTAATTSFFPAKPLGVYGDGGAIFTHDSELHGKICSIRVHGQGEHRYETLRLGITGRLDTLQAAILLEKIKIFPQELEEREARAKIYAVGLSPYVQVPMVPPHSRSTWAQYTVRTPHREALRSSLENAGIPTGIYYPKPLHLQPPYQGYPQAPGGLGETEKAAGEVLSLPMHAYLSPQTQSRIIKHVKGFFQQVDTSGA